MRSDGAFLALQDGGSPIRNPSTAAEDARLSSLITLEGILNQVKVAFSCLTTSSLWKYGFGQRTFSFDMDICKITGYLAAVVCDQNGQK